MRKSFLARPKKWPLVFLCALIAIFGIVFSIAWSGKTKAPGPSRTKENNLPTANNANGNVSSTPAVPQSDTRHPNGSDFGTPEAYLEYLNSLCPQLSPVEEDRILLASKRDARVLAALALELSPRAITFLNEALRKAPDDPLVLYAILSRRDPGFDRLKLARDLIRIQPQDAEPLYAAASEAMKMGDREAAMAYLREAAKRDNFSSLHQTAIDARLNAYRLAGFQEQDPLTRVYLDGRLGLADGAIDDVNSALDLYARDSSTRPGNEEAAALMLDAAQKALNSPGRTLTSHRMALEMELWYLRAFTRLEAEAADPASVSQYLKVSPGQMLSEANKERKDFYPIGLFSQDTQGIYQRLAPEQKVELIQRIQKDGHFPAFQWAYQVRPDIFRSPEFVPQGFTQEIWNAQIQKMAQ